MMILININSINKIVNLLEQGQVLVIPTDTIFGISCKFTDFAAIKQIYAIKKRPLHKPLTVLVKDWEQAQVIGQFSESLITKVKTNFLSDKVTVIVPIAEKLKTHPYWGTLTTIAIRVSNSLLIQKITALVGPIVSTSCNISDQKIINDITAMTSLGITYVVVGKPGTNKPSVIYNSINDKIIRS